MDSAPFLPTSPFTREQKPDPDTQALAELLNARIPIPQEQSVQRSTVLAAGLDDRDQNVGYHQLPVNTNFQALLVHKFEAPELNIPGDLSVYFDRTLSFKQVGDNIIVKLRAPEINEGF